MEFRFTILLPVNRPPAMLPYAIESVLSQTLADFELFIVGDGAPEETIACAQSYAARDLRIKVFRFSKGAQCGEAHRHAALEHARGRYVAHLADNDLWLPNHLEEMEKLLKVVDFGHLINVEVGPDGSFQVIASNLASAKFRQRILDEIFNTLGDTVTGYRLTAYRSLPEGWAPPPEIEYPDLKMWRKFLRRDELKFGTRAVVTALIFPTERRRHMSLDERAGELQGWHLRLQDPLQRAEFVESCWRSLVIDWLQCDAHRAARLVSIHVLQAQLSRLQQLANHRLEPGWTIDFSERGNSPLYTVSGWGDQERDMRWTDGAEAVIRVRLKPQQHGYPDDLRLVRLRACAFAKPQRLTVLIDGNSPVELLIDHAWRHYDIVVGSFKYHDESEVRLLLPDAHSPKSIGLSEDPRKLGIAVSSVSFLPSQSRIGPS